MKATETVKRKFGPYKKPMKPGPKGPRTKITLPEMAGPHPSYRYTGEENEQKCVENWLRKRAELRLPKTI